MRMGVLACRLSHCAPPSPGDGAIPAGGFAVFAASLQDAGVFRPSRLVCSVQGGPIVDLARFYAVRARRGKSRRRSRRCALLAASEAMRVARDPRSIPPLVFVTDVHIGAASQFAEDAKIPADVFAPAAMFGALTLDSMKTGHEIRVSIDNPDGRVASVRVVVMGRAQP